MATFWPSRTSGEMRRKLAGSARSHVINPIGISSVGTKDHTTPLGADASGRRFEQADDAQPQVPVAERGLLFADTLGKMAHHPLQGLARFDVRTPDVPAA